MSRQYLSHVRQLEEHRGAIVAAGGRSLTRFAARQVLRRAARDGERAYVRRKPGGKLLVAVGADADAAFLDDGQPPPGVYPRPHYGPK